MTGRVEILPLMAGRGDPKSGRIRAFVSLMANGEWGIPEGDVDITTQVLNYDMRLKDQEDDIIDSCAYGPMMHEMYSHLILAAGQGLDFDELGNAAWGMEVAGV
jgi:hypothetical protein